MNNKTFGGVFQTEQGPCAISIFRRIGRSVTKTGDKRTRSYNFRRRLIGPTPQTRTFAMHEEMHGSPNLRGQNSTDPFPELSLLTTIDEMHSEVQNPHLPTSSRHCTRKQIIPPGTHRCKCNTTQGKQTYNSENGNVAASSSSDDWSFAVSHSPPVSQVCDT